MRASCAITARHNRYLGNNIIIILYFIIIHYRLAREKRYLSNEYQFHENIYIYIRKKKSLVHTYNIVLLLF